jgi:hypothetical protein
VTVHDVEKRIHAENGSAAEGRVTGEVDGDELDTPFCDVFEFDENDELITRITVYTNK